MVFETDSKIRNLFHLHRFLIDCKHQGMGFGRAALEELKRGLWNFGRVTPREPLVVKLNTKAVNEDAIRVYRKAGFTFEPKPGDDSVVLGTLMIKLD